MRYYFSMPIAALFLASILTCPLADSQEDKTFPTDDEIRLVITQTERALPDYTATVTLEEKLAGQPTDVENDKRVLDGLAVMSKGISAQPQKFNSPIGFEFVLLLDDASRNASLCNADAIQKGIKVTMAGDTRAAQDYLQLAQACTSVSNLIYTISENAGALYQRYVNGEESLAMDAFNTMNKCIATLKQKSK
jgi:hypothetical protein